MRKTMIIGGIVVFLLIAAFFFIRINTKSGSPEGNIEYRDDNVRIDIYYNRPYKRGREIFGKLVPYGKTWRTGANEATTFNTNQDLKFGDKVLKAGKYSLWSVPGEKSWLVVFNSEVPLWGIDFHGEAQRNIATDELVLEVPVMAQNKVFEQFTISIEKVVDGAELVFIWDKTLVAVPFTVK